MPGKCIPRWDHPPLPITRCIFALPLGETKVVATRRDGLDDLAAESLIALILGEIKFYRNNKSAQIRRVGEGGGGGTKNLRLKQVCELGNLSLLP